MREIVASLCRKPWLLPTIVSLIIALAFADQASGSAALAMLTVALSITVGKHWARWHRPVRNLHFLTYTVIAAFGISTLWHLLHSYQGWRLGDWGIQHAVLKGMMPFVPGFDAPVWNHHVSTGDAPLDTYPTLAYWFTAHVAWMTGLRDDLPRAMNIVAVAVHIWIAIMTTRIAARVAPLLIAAAIGILCIVDIGSLSSGGIDSLFRWGLFHHAFAQAVFLTAVIAIFDALQRPRLFTSIKIWLLIGLATAAHPSALLQSALALAALAAVALLATDIKPRRAGWAACHICVGIALSATVWMPLGDRLLAHGQHFSTMIDNGTQVLRAVLSGRVPGSSFALVMSIGVFGLFAALWSRRSAAVFIGVFGLLALLALSDRLYNAFEILPSPGGVRIGVARFMSIGRPFILIAAAFVIGLVVAALRARWNGSSGWRLSAIHATTGLLLLAGGRAGCDALADMRTEAQDQALTLAPDVQSQLQLTTWARQEMAAIPAGHMARALIDADDQHQEFSLVADAGMPVFHLGAIPNLLLRNRMTDATEESLRRFNIKWVIARDRSPSAGDPASEITIGSFHIRTVATWDGQFARTFDTRARVLTTVLSNREVIVQVTPAQLSGANLNPTLVALGTGFYPRWQATHESGYRTEVFAVNATTAASSNVVGAYVLPGVTRFTLDAALPSDSHGRWLSIVSAILAIARVVVFSRQRWRWRLLRRWVQIRRYSQLGDGGYLHWRAALSIVATTVLIWWAVRDSSVPEPAIIVGGGMRSTATVSARAIDGQWQDCNYHRLLGEYACPGLLTASDRVATLLNDDTASWPFPTPSIVAIPQRTGVSVRVSMNRRVNGRYWIASSNADGTVTVDDKLLTLSHPTIANYSFDDKVAITVQCEDIPLAGWKFTMVREDAIGATSK
jgi:hypothetical protein